MRCVSGLWSSPNMADAPAALKYLSETYSRPVERERHSRMRSNTSFVSP